MCYILIIKYNMYIYYFFILTAVSIFTFMHLADAFIQSDLHSGYTFFFISMCVPWELNPQPFALRTQCSTTEPQEHYIYLSIYIYTHK